MHTNDDEYNIIHKTWEERKSHAQKGEHGEYIDLDEGMISSAGLNFKDMESPGNFRTFNNPSGETRNNYTVHALGSGRFRINRNH